MTSGLSDALPSISVVICTFNGAKRLLPTLEHLRQQKGAEQIEWEVVVVDNASTDDTAAVARTLWPTNSPVPLSIVGEPEQGLSNARRCGVFSTKHDIVSFVDDDNWVSENWIALIANIFAENHDVGACGGRGIAAFEGTKPDWFERFQDSFAVGTQGWHRGILPADRLLWGAGLSIRTKALRTLFEAGFQQINSDHTGTSLIASGDYELCCALRLAGWKLFYDPDLVYQHFMPASRLTWSHLKRLVNGAGRGAVGIKHYVVRLALDSGKSGFLTRARQAWLVEAIITLGALVWLPLSYLLSGNRERAVVSFNYGWGRLAELLRSPARFWRGRRRVSDLARSIRRSRG